MTLEQLFLDIWRTDVITLLIGLFIMAIIMGLFLALLNLLEFIFKKLTKGTK